MIISADLVDTMHNVVVRVKNYFDDGIYNYHSDGFDTLAMHSFIIPEDCFNGKIALDFFKDYV